MHYIKHMIIFISITLSTFRSFEAVPVIQANLESEDYSHLKRFYKEIVDSFELGNN